MRFYCEESSEVVEAPSFEENDEGENSPHNGVGEHTHCNDCSGHLYLKDCRDLKYISERLRRNKLELDKHGAKQHLPGKHVEISDFEALKKAQADEKMLIFAYHETLKLENEKNV